MKDAKAGELKGPLFVRESLHKYATFGDIELPRSAKLQRDIVDVLLKDRNSEFSADKRRVGCRS
jgi:hypothetical protein